MSLSVPAPKCWGHHDRCAQSNRCECSCGKVHPPDSLVVGVPGQIVVRDHPFHSPDEKEDLEHGSLPDTISETLAALIAHVESLEKRLNGGSIYGPALHTPEHGVWHREDFAI